MGISNSTAKHRQNIYDTPPKNHAQRFLFDPRSPTDEISRTPIQIDNGKLYNHVASQIIGPNIPLPENSINNENLNCDEEEEEEKDSEPKRSSGVEPTLDPTKVLTALVANNDGRLPPYQL